MRPEQPSCGLLVLPQEDFPAQNSVVHSHSLLGSNKLLCMAAIDFALCACACAWVRAANLLVVSLELCTTIE